MVRFDGPPSMLSMRSGAGLPKRDREPVDDGAPLDGVVGAYCGHQDGREADPAGPLARQAPLLVEHGRAVVGPAGVALYRVPAVEHTPQRTWVVVDGGRVTRPAPPAPGGHAPTDRPARPPGPGFVFTTEFGEPCDPRNAFRA